MSLGAGGPVTFALPDAAEAAAAIRRGELSSEALVGSCLDRIDEAENDVQAWAFLDAEHALAQARVLDAARAGGEPCGPLHGVPVGIKDIVDTADMPTEYGTPLHAGRRPTADATVVALLRQAGAVIMGKTVTTELAVYTPGKTRNPHNLDHTPGGSSSGSAASVAAGMVPLAVGTQTNGSIIRPASFCGVVGFKPTFGRISRHGCLQLSRPLDQIGVFAGTVEDAALVADVLMAFDGRDPDVAPAARPDLVVVAGSEPPVRPRLGFVRSPAWDEATDATRAAFDELVATLGDDASQVALEEPFAQVGDWHRLVMEADLAMNLAQEYARGGEVLSARLKEMIERGQEHLAVDYNRALGWIPVLNRLLEPAFDRNDALLTPATTGPAPLGLGSTGSPVFCTLWSFLGVPAISLPLFRDDDGLPFGAQLIGRRGDDGRLLRTARWLMRRVAEPAT
jgi:Asp-tRNA(Asn)/Glu-tRNA(Gln) amidotransferase A subunit family amidase